MSKLVFYTSTSFYTVWTFRWCRLPFWISTASEEFQRRLRQVLGSLKCVLLIHYDILIFGEGSTEKQDLKYQDKNFLALLQRCREQNVKLNKEKTKLRCKEVSFLSHMVSEKVSKKILKR